ncbi:hypothetical protein N7454_006776 [Penicillium verhagenii]|nr:hypothetical protein N7454_006776 [Penicillium verhagenii]
MANYITGSIPDCAMSAHWVKTLFTGLTKLDSAMHLAELHMAPDGPAEENFCFVGYISTGSMVSTSQNLGTLVEQLGRGQ